MVEEGVHDGLFAGLKALSETAFPKSCANCGRVYNDAQTFLTETQSIRGRSGLKSSWDDDGSTLVELYRNCVCGSTLMDFFSERRDASDQGGVRRKKFSELVSLLQDKGIAVDAARQELIKLLRGDECTLLAELGFKSRRLTQ